MQPPVKQHLENMYRVMASTVLPRLADDPFVAEAAGGIAASLALLMEIQPYEDDYLRLELADTRKALTAVGADTGLGTGAETSTPADHDALVAAVAAAKDRLNQRIVELTQANGGTLPQAQRDALNPILDRQLTREQSWTRLTPFNPEGTTLPTIAEILAQQRSAP